MTVSQLFNKALQLEAKGDLDQAADIYQVIISLAPKFSSPYFNLGLIQKHRGQWQQSFENNKRVTELEPKDIGSWWNLGIAATALQNWEVARQAWNHVGLNLPISPEEPRMPPINTPIRLNPLENPEVVWALRIDPARAVIDNVPLPDSTFRFKDTVLNDGEAIGFRIHNGIKFPVFNVLQLIERSSYKTYSLQALVNDQVHIDQLLETCGKSGIGFDDWSNIRLLCEKCCTETPNEHFGSPVVQGVHTKRIFGIAAINAAEIYEILHPWSINTDSIIGELTLEFE